MKEEVQKTGDNGAAAATQPRRPRGMASMAKKLAELALELQQTARAEEERTRSDEGHARRLLEKALGAGTLDHILKNSTNLGPEDREFLRDRGGWKV